MVKGPEAISNKIINIYILIYFLPNYKNAVATYEFPSLGMTATCYSTRSE